METNTLELFREPTAAYRGKPFWSWNGVLNKEELFRQIHAFKDMGFGGFFMHSRTGLVTEYLGEEWFELINACAEEAERLGMEAWLYDEDRWPSGTAGGLVTEEPRFQLKFIRLCVIPAEQFVWQDDLIAAFECRLDELSYYDCVPLSRDQSFVGAAGKSVLAFTIETQAKETFYNGYTYLDTLNREAVDRFLEITHEAYKSHNGAHFGKAIKGIFTDEPHRGALMDGFGLRNEDASWLAPWTYTLFDRFKETYGYELLERLPELFLRPEGREVSQVKWHYVDLLQHMFHDNFAKPINEWCERNDLILTGHTLHEDSLSAQSAMVGSIMRFYEHMGYPGVDVLTEGNLNYWIVKQLSSAARQLGKPWLLSELYGCTGWQMPLEAHKSVGDWQALFGINVRCHHLSWYTMEGEAKRDFPASISYQSAWWKDYEKLETYFSRLGVVLSQGTPLCDLLVINPVESLWGQIYPGWSRGLSAQSPEIQKLEQIYQDTFHALAGAQLDFDYGDEEMLSRLSSLEQDENGRAVLRVGEATYRAVLVTGLATMRRTTLRLLEAFRAAGGQVVFAGEAPGYVDAESSEEARDLAAQSIRTSLDGRELVSACQTAASQAIQVRSASTGEPLRHIYAQARQDGEQSYYVLMSMDREEWTKDAVVTIQGSGSLQEWFCATGERVLVETDNHNGALQFTVDFPPSGEHVYVLTREADKSLPVESNYTIAAAAPINGSFAYRLDEPNVCVLDRASYRLNGGEEQGPYEVLKTDRAIRQALVLPFRHGEMIQPWYARKFHGQSFEEKAALTLVYRFNIEVLPEQPVYLAIESPELFKISLNGSAVANIGSQNWWVDRCFIKLPLPASALQVGPNAIELTSGFHPGINIEAIYLLGEFGVKTEGFASTLNSLPQTLEVGDITKQGLPFYGGTLTYVLSSEQLDEARQALAENRGAGDRTVVAVPGFEAGCLRIRSEGLPENVLAWQPYEAEVVTGKREGASVEIDFVLTRRNSFGPLHQIPLHDRAYGPGNWLTDGDNFSDSYVLLPSGLLEQPQLVVQQPRK